MFDIFKQDDVFRYGLLSRMQQDCEYYLGWGNRSKARLWAGDEKRQIEIMIQLHNSFDPDKKPQWLSMEEILEYRKKMVKP